jgi:hypothetical protein
MKRNTYRRKREATMHETKRTAAARRGRRRMCDAARRHGSAAVEQGGGRRRVDVATERGEDEVSEEDRECHEGPQTWSAAYLPPRRQLHVGSAIDRQTPPTQ